MLKLKSVQSYPGLRYFVSFDHFLAKKKDKCHPISMLRQDLEPSHQGASFRPQNERRVTTLFVDPYCNFRTLVARDRVGMKIFREMKHVNVFPQIQGTIKS